MNYDLAHDLARALKGGEEYLAYRHTLKKVIANPDSHRMLEDFRVRQIEVQSAQLMGQSVDEKTQKEVEQLYHLVSFHPAIKEFIAAEARLIKVLTDVQRILADALDLSLPPAPRETAGKTYGETNGETNGETAGGGAGTEAKSEGADHEA